MQHHRNSQAGTLPHVLQPTTYSQGYFLPLAEQHTEEGARLHFISSCRNSVQLCKDRECDVLCAGSSIYYRPQSSIKLIKTFRTFKRWWFQRSLTWTLGDKEPAGLRACLCKSILKVRSVTPLSVMGLGTRRVDHRDCEAPHNMHGVW